MTCPHIITSDHGQLARQCPLCEKDAEISDWRRRAELAEAALERKGYRRSCDITACNCGDQWTHGGHAEMRLREISEALTQFDARRNGETILADVIHALSRAEHERDAEIARLREALTNIQAACMNDRLFRLFTEQKFWHAHYVDIVWRFDGKDERAEADWLKTVWYELRAALAKEG